MDIINLKSIKNSFKIRFQSSEILSKFYMIYINKMYSLF